MDMYELKCWGLLAGHHRNRRDRRGDAIAVNKGGGVDTHGFGSGVDWHYWRSVRQYTDRFARVFKPFKPLIP
jgi:hypothetical protein